MIVTREAVRQCTSCAPNPLLPASIVLIAEIFFFGCPLYVASYGCRLCDFDVCQTCYDKRAKDDDKDLVPPGPPGTATLMRQWSESTIRQLEFSLQNSEMLKQLQDEADEARPLPQHLGRDISALRDMDQFADCTVAGHAAHRLILW